MSLGRKQNIQNADWIAAMKNIESAVSRENLDALTEKTVRNIAERTDGLNAAYAWSGGKDSIVLGEICKMANVQSCMMGVCDLEYPAFMDWIEKHKPENCEIINTGQDLNWLSKNPGMLFPKTSAVASRWFSIVQHNAQRQYFKSRKPDIIILGRRRADGNYVGRGGNTIYTDGKGVTRFSPLADWTHEDILAFIHYHKLPLPPIYGWSNGYRCGTHPWPARQWTGNEENGWREIYEIDPRIVADAAEYLPGAKAFLNGGAAE